MKKLNHFENVLRKKFSNEDLSLVPDLVSLQLDSYKKFLAVDAEKDSEERKNSGITDSLKSIFPMSDKNDLCVLDFESYEFGTPKYEYKECLHSDRTYEIPLYVNMKFILFDSPDISISDSSENQIESTKKNSSEKKKKRDIKAIKRQKVFLSNIPLMTEKGSFIFNGIQRVVVSQLKKSPGVFFEKDNDRYTGRIIPYLGSWIDFEFDNKPIIEQVLYATIDKKKKNSVTTIFNAFGLDKKSCIEKFYKPLEINILKDNILLSNFRLLFSDSYEISYLLKLLESDEDFKNFVINEDLKVNNNLIVKIGDILTPDVLKKLEKSNIKNIELIDFNEKYLLKQELPFDIKDEKGSIIFKKGDKLLSIDNLKKIPNKILLNLEDLSHFVLFDDVFDKKTGEVIIHSLENASDSFNSLKKHTDLFKVILPHFSVYGPYIYNTFWFDERNGKNKTHTKSLMEMYKSIRGEDATTEKQAEDFFDVLFKSNRYNLSNVGRMKINKRLKLESTSKELKENLLTIDALIDSVKLLCKIKTTEKGFDDIDSLSNRRLNTVGELVKEQFMTGLIKLQRTIQERIDSPNYDKNSMMPTDFINHKVVETPIKDFFATSQLAQFMDQTNPLSEISHKRRITGFGPGGFSKEKNRVGFEPRDIHYTQYGKICPVETPEGQNIGIVTNLSLFAKIDDYGFITTPYKKVKNGVVQDKIEYLSASDEYDKVICSSYVKQDKNGKILDKSVLCRINENFEKKSPEEVNYIDVSTRQIGSVSANLIPFIECDDAKRSLLASNMMRQAVPFANSEMPFVGTGLEKLVASNSQSIIKAKHSGIVKDVDSSKIVIETKNNNSLSDIDVYYLDKYIKTNNDTCINQRPIVDVGDEVEENQPLTNAQGIDNNEISIGKNVLIAFLPWDGYNHEDSIVVSERLIRDEVFTSIHIQEFEISARDNRIGPEEITRDIPNVSESVLRNLDESGIIHIGAEVKPGDILVGRTSKKSESHEEPEDKLLNEIFDKKSFDVKDTSLYLPQGVLSGTVIDVQVFNRQGLELDERSKIIQNQKIQELQKTKSEVELLLKENLVSRIKKISKGCSLLKPVSQLKKGDTLSDKLLDSLSQTAIQKIVLTDSKKQKEIDDLNIQYETKIKQLEDKYKEDEKKIVEGEDLKQDILKTVKVTVATKQKIQPGDKMTGRHGNKGVVSRVLPIADMPYTEDGTPIDILLTPSGIPSRMNIGQVLETHLGWVSANLGKQISKILDTINDNKKKELELRNKFLSIYDREDEQKIIKDMSYEELLSMSEKCRKGVPFATGSFSGVDVSKIENMMDIAGVDKSGKAILFDGRTGERFEREVAIGYMYMLKLYHLVDTKIHARATGPYSLVTQQPLQGKSHFGGQRMGEMECWALQGYGASYTLQEMLTVKSDDVSGRNEMFKSIVRKDQHFACGIPESFNVMVLEVKSLGLNFELK